MTSRLVVIASAPAAGQHRGRAPGADDGAVPMAEADRARLVAAVGPVTDGWHAPERAARETARRIAVATDAAAALAAWWGPDGDEPLAELLARAGRWLDDVDAGIRRAAVVASPPVVRALVVHALGAAPAVFWRLDVAALSVSVLTRADDQWRVRSLSAG